MVWNGLVDRKMPNSRSKNDFSLSKKKMFDLNYCIVKMNSCTLDYALFVLLKYQQNGNEFHLDKLNNVPLLGWNILIVPLSCGWSMLELVSHYSSCKECGHRVGNIHDPPPQTTIIIRSPKILFNFFLSVKLQFVLSEKQLRYLALVAGNMETSVKCNDSYRFFFAWFRHNWFSADTATWCEFP